MKNLSSLATEDQIIINQAEVIVRKLGQPVERQIDRDDITCNETADDYRYADQFLTITKSNHFHDGDQGTTHHWLIRITFAGTPVFHVATCGVGATEIHLTKLAGRWEAVLAQLYANTLSQVDPNPV